jgi:hypothetical protein
VLGCGLKEMRRIVDEGLLRARMRKDGWLRVRREVEMKVCRQWK